MVSLINLNEVHRKCVEEFAQNTIDDIEIHILECRSAEAWKAINLFCGIEFRFTNCANSESIYDTKLKIKNHHAAVLNQAPSVNLVMVSTESPSLINKYDYSFTIPEIRTALKHIELTQHLDRMVHRPENSNYVTWKKMH